MNSTFNKIILTLSIFTSLAACSGSPAEPIIFDDGVSAAPSVSPHFANAQNFVDAQSTDLLSLENSTSEIKVLRVKHHKVECESYQLSQCLVVQHESNADWTYFYDTIEGFEYDWGYDYEITVEILSTQLSAAAPAQKKYRLLEIQSKQLSEQDTSFQYTSRYTKFGIAPVSEGVFTLLGGKLFNCDEQACQSIESILAQNQSAKLVFQHNANPEDPLILTEVMCADSPASFNGSCN